MHLQIYAVEFFLALVYIGTHLAMDYFPPQLIFVVKNFGPDKTGRLFDCFVVEMQRVKKGLKLSRASKYANKMHIASLLASYIFSLDPAKEKEIGRL